MVLLVIFYSTLVRSLVWTLHFAVTEIYPSLQYCIFLVQELLRLFRSATSCDRRLYGLKAISLILCVSSFKILVCYPGGCLCCKKKWHYCGGSGSQQTVVFMLAQGQRELGDCFALKQNNLHLVVSTKGLNFSFGNIRNCIFGKKTYLKIITVTVKT